MALSSSLIRFSALGFCALGLFWGCATGNDTETDDASTSSTASSGGMGGEGGMVGVGGAGDDDCELDCSSFNTPPCLVSVCNTGTYPGTVGECVVVPDTDGTSCDDGQFCTLEDSCVEGICIGGPANDCGLVAGECEEIACNEQSDSCAPDPANDGASCTSSDLCQLNTTCQNGTCGGGQPNGCLFAPLPEPTECHVAVCDPQTGNCVAETGNDGAACTDSNDLCTVNKACAAGVCDGGAPKDCSQLTEGCETGVCDVATGDCMAMAVADGELCDDLSACTVGETCTASTCGGGTPVTACSQTPDGCCPAGCTAQNDYECNCPGAFINGTCVYLSDPAASHELAGAEAVCQGMGAGWGLCDPALLCDNDTLTYLNAAGCDCSGGSSACSCGGIANVYVHVTGGSSPYYINSSQINGCGTGSACTNSVSQSCGVALCCRS